MHDIETNLFNSLQWRTIVDGLNDGVLVNLQGRHVFANRRVEELLEYAPGELIGTRIEDVIHPDHAEQIADRWRQRLKGIPVPRIYESSFVSKNGVKIPVELSVSLLEWTDQEAGVVTIRDIRERNRHRDQIRRSSRLLEYFFKDSHTCFALIDGNMNFTRVNTAFAGLFKRDVEFFTGKPSSQFFHREKQALLEQVRERGVAHHEEAGLLQFTGRDNMVSRYCNWSIIPVFDDGGCVEYVGVSLADVTEQTSTKIQLELRERELLAHRDNLEELVRQRSGQLLESESRFRRMSNSAPALIWLVDENNQVEWFNNSWRAYTGSGAEDCSAAKWQDYVHPDDRAYCEHTYNKSWSERVRFHMEHRLRRHSGVYGWVSVVGEPRFTEDGSFEGFIGYCWDVTEQKRTEFELSAAKEQSETASRAKSEFLSRMSHELRTPLNAVLGFAQLLQTDVRSQLQPNQLECVSEILRAGYHLLELITEILDLSHVESGKVQINIRDVGLASIINECVSLVTPDTDKRNIAISVPKEEILHLQVRADAIRLKQVILNLLSNSVKYNRPGGTIDVSIGVEPENRLRIFFRDTGIGIEESRAGELFVPFSRLGAETTDIEGTGIGLVITKRLLEMFGGTIGFSSKPGVGSTFWIELDLAAAQQDKPPLGSGKQARVLTIMYIDSDLANVRMVERILARHSHIRLLCATDIEMALQMMESCVPDVVMLDWEITTPAADSLAARLQGGNREVRLIAYGHEKSREPLELLQRSLYAYIPRVSLPGHIVSVLEQVYRDVA